VLGHRPTRVALSASLSPHAGETHSPHEGDDEARLELGDWAYGEVLSRTAVDDGAFERRRGSLLHAAEHPRTLERENAMKAARVALA
jgi:hypothetical protein